MLNKRSASTPDNMSINTNAMPNLLLGQLATNH